MILYINSCVREDSRTDKIARALLEKLGGEYTELNLNKENISPLTIKALERRMALIYKGNFDAPNFKYARQFASADIIVVSAPYWDLSFPSILKVYFENIYINGVVSRYNEKGLPVGLCKGKKLYYVATSGGQFVPDYSYDYVKNLTVNCFGVKETQLICAEMLDVDGYDAEKIVADTIANITL